MAQRSIVLLAGASGSGKSRAARLSGCPQVALDDFYRDADTPGLPRVRSRGIIDWDDLRSWDADAALVALTELVETGRTELPTYSISQSRRTGYHVVDLGTAPIFVAEGIFAAETAQRCRAAGLRVQCYWLDRPRTLTALLRVLRDLRESRKPPVTLLRRGFALWRAEPALRRRNLAAGFTAIGFRDLLALLRDSCGQDAGEAGRALHEQPEADPRD